VPAARCRHAQHLRLQVGQLGPERVFTWWMSNATSGDVVMDQTLEKMLRFLYDDGLPGDEAARAAQQIGSETRERFERIYKGAHALLQPPVT
jgi:hypothetical protein